MLRKLVNNLPVLVLVLLAAGVLLISRGEADKSYQPTQTSEPVTQKEIDFASFDLVGDGFHLLYEELSVPNTLELVNAPEITGNQAADAHIRKLAEDRGYRLRRIVSSESDLVATNTFVDLQPEANSDWQNLKSAAEAEGVFMTVRSGYRSINEQRDLFIGRLNDVRVNLASVASGSQDIAIDDVLRTTAPPGYSRHHTGYTVDLRSSDAETFAASAGYSWISSNNFENALKFGYIPSYPEGAIDQGPNPEAWEFVWVGIDLIEKQISENENKVTDSN